MDRLQALIAHVDDADFVHGFVAPTLIDPWVRYLERIRPRADPTDLIPPRHRRNIGYRLQLAEFECALLLLNLETQRQFNGASTLHGTISSMKMHQFVVLTHSVLEGIGAHLVRVHRRMQGQAVNPNDKIATRIWRPALVDEVLNSAQPPPIARADLIARLQDLTDWRDRIHMDRIEPHDPLHINEFDNAGRFIPAHQTFRMILSGLSPNWPPETCLNEHVV